MQERHILQSSKSKTILWVLFICILGVLIFTRKASAMTWPPVGSTITHPVGMLQSADIPLVQNAISNSTELADAYNKIYSEVQ